MTEAEKWNESHDYDCEEDEKYCPECGSRKFDYAYVSKRTGRIICCSDCCREEYYG